jgi:hypothetical protein
MDYGQGVRGMIPDKGKVLFFYPQRLKQLWGPPRLLLKDTSV